MIPGINLLNVALGVIGWQEVNYFPCIGKQIRPDGIVVTEFGETVTIPDGSVQAVEEKTYREYGLDMSRHYVMWFVSHPVMTLTRDYDGDEFEYDNRRFKVDASVRWNPQDGWCQVLGWEIKP